MYENGYGITQDHLAAVSWYRKAADQGNIAAQFNLGNLYDVGQGTPQDSAAAVELYQKAAEQGLPAAQYNLGRMYRNGDGVSQDVAAAAKWYQMAAEQGLSAAQHELGACMGTERAFRKTMSAHTCGSVYLQRGEKMMQREIGLKSRQI
jgi:TPR repeat protein